MQQQLTLLRQAGFAQCKTLALGQITSMCSRASLQLIEVSSPVHCSSWPDTQHFHQCICDYLSPFIFLCFNITHLIKLLPATSQLSDCALANGV